MTGFLSIAVRPGHKLTEKENEEYKRLMKEHNIPEDHSFDVSQEGEFAVSFLRNTSCLK